MAGKYKKAILMAGKQEEEKQESRQEVLHERYGITDPDTVIVEKNRALEVLVFILRIVADMVLVMLAVCGAAALIYPEVRECLWELLQQAIGEMAGYLGG